jgi:glycerate 2-kinase
MRKDSPPFNRCHVIAAGKAAVPMMRACFESGLPIARGLMAAPHAMEGWTGIELFAAGHPTPTLASAAAGARALDMARSADPSDVLVLLLSGGASALFAAPAPGLTLDDKVQTTRVLLEAGAAIHDLNTVRKHLSAIKGGQLAAAATCPTVTFLLSDVVGPVESDASVIGSGPSVPDPSTFHDALAVLDRLNVRGQVPRAALAVLESGASGARPETPKPGDARLAHSHVELIGDRHIAVEGARREAEHRGYAVAVSDAAVVGEARVAGPALLAQALERLRGLPRPGCHLSSGETTVRVIGRGRGGRNQELTLALVQLLAGIDGPIVAGSIGTDGVDGPTDAAGALAASDTLARGQAAGLDVAAALSNNDAYTYFDALDGLVRTGWTETNVGDVQVVLRG